MIDIDNSALTPDILGISGINNLPHRKSFIVQVPPFPPLRKFSFSLKIMRLAALLQAIAYSKFTFFVNNTFK
jgi:hypothetical protein